MPETLANASRSYAFNAWIPLITYNTTYAPRFLAGNTTTVCLIVCAALTLTVAVVLQKRDDKKSTAAAVAAARCGSGTSGGEEEEEVNRGLFVADGVRRERVVRGSQDDEAKNAATVVDSAA